MPATARRGRERVRVRAERTRPLRKLLPPDDAAPHPWATPMPATPPLYVDRALVATMIQAAQDGAREDREAMALVLGDRFEAPVGPPFSVALAMATAPLEASAGHVRFDARSFDELARALDGQDFDYLLVGWFHSHLGVGCFLSATDRTTHARFFRGRHQFAVVVDPVRRRAQAFQLVAGEEFATGFAVFDSHRAGGPSYRRARTAGTPTSKESPL